MTMAMAARPARPAARARKLERIWRALALFIGYQINIC